MDCNKKKREKKNGGSSYAGRGKKRVESEPQARGYGVGVAGDGGGGTTRRQKDRRGHAKKEYFQYIVKRKLNIAVKEIKKIFFIFRKKFLQINYLAFGIITKN